VVHLLALRSARLYGVTNFRYIAVTALDREGFSRQATWMTASPRFSVIAFVLLASTALLPAGAPPLPVADLAVTKTVDKDQANPGDTLTYSIPVTNNGPDRSTQATLIDKVPATLVVTSFDAGSADWSCQSSGGGNGPTTFTCTNASGVPLGSAYVFTLVATVKAGTPPGTFITNEVTISTPPDSNNGDTDPNPENNTAFANTTVAGGTQGDLSVSKVANTDQALPDSNVTFTIQVASSGNISDASLNDTLPSNMTFVSFSQNSGPTWSCSTPNAGSGGTVSCTNPSLPSGSASTFVITGHIPVSARSGDPYENFATVSSPDDINSENDSSEATVTVVAAIPTLTTQASGSVMLGGSISDIATLSGSQAATGTIGFVAYGPDDSTCSNPAFTSDVNVQGDGQYTSGPFTPTVAGTYRFIANYSGDLNNKAVTTACSDVNESVVVIGPTPTPTATATATATPTATPPPSQTTNLSTRVRTETGDKVMIGGFILTGNVPKAVVLRGLGPSLSRFGITDLLLDPVLELRGESGNLIFRNDNWKDTQRNQIEGTPFQPTDDRESVIVTTLPPTAYTVILTGNNQTTGIGAVEVYDNNSAVDSQLGNLSTRGFVQTQDKVMIGGFTLGVSNNPTRIAVRGLGPSLAQAGLSNVLADPTLELRDANGALLISNDDWQSDPVSAGQLTANGLALPNPKEAGIFTLLPGGQFTAILAGKNGGVGIGLVEIYNLR
jgi:uncharacterized repeat protein (TIGR01451 family)